MEISNESATQLCFDPPPIWPDIKTELRKYIECPERLPIHQLDRAQCYLPRYPNILSLLTFDLAPVGTTLKFDRDPITGCLGTMRETSLKRVGDTARNSMSMTRAPVTNDDGVRGNPSNIPFWPGGFDEPEITDNTILDDIDFERNLRTLAKGFSSGLEFKSDNYTVKEVSSVELQKEAKTQSVESEMEKINLMAIVHEEENMLGLWMPNESTKEEEEKVVHNLPDEIPLLEDDIPMIPMDNVPVLKISEKKSITTQAEWAEQLDVSIPVDDFEKRIPDPALTFEYKLDIFQKQAILKLEDNCNVFVAAHTSAGKTTVAEYAIALSQKHMTRVIYTSPIKALSNQKYRDFKKKFESVGLLTGDLQINQTASCLIMTTEILQSMLYCASEVLRDLEFVIFDEVHYINNEDRGHVWEEIVILLPQTVTIVMLSATVPNPLEFANWVGRIKRRKMYVISTVKRPIPLQHYLYTGTDGKTKDDIFLLLDANNQLRWDGWHQAYLTKHPNGSTKEPKGTSKRRMLTAKQEKEVWRVFISHLKKNDLLPVVVFTLSRRRCDMSAAALESLDLTTANEKHKVHVLFQNSIKHLKGTDRELPQVLLMQRLLEKGVGIHHSGILPILKEIVEMLFQNGVVKLLFATETFAMGVNMPARTVAFDSIQKFDGNAFRILYPTEYIQMAGRAGRRGHDTTGTVIIMCRHDVPDFNDLKCIMCGEPQTLQSKFKVTYSMVLNLRRVNESVTVEAMMRRSFRESSTASKQSVFQTKLMDIERELSSLPPFTNMQQKLSEFYHMAVEYLEEYKQLRPNMLESKKVMKSLSEGRIIFISQGEHYNKLGILLSSAQRNQGICQFKVLVLKNGDTQNSDKDTTNDSNASNNKSERWHNIIALIKRGVFVPTGNPSYEILTIYPWDILDITNCTAKVDCNAVLKEWEKRQISRIRNEPPNAACSVAIQQLTTLSLHAAANPQVLAPFMELKTSHDLAVRERDLKILQEKLFNIKCIQIPNFEEQFEPVFFRNELENKKRQLQLKLSDEGMALYPEYIRMVALLKDLRYIDSDERVALKGRVALQMGSNELLITELILKNVLTALPPAEIVALLSALIFQQRTDVKPTLTPELKQGCAVMEEVFDSLQRLEQNYGISTLQPLNFGLVEVVYEWAQGKSFAEITERTNVQEGIIVRCIQQLNETLRDVKNAAITIGDPVLKEKMEEASTAIKRDIVFTASLYTQD